VSVIPAKAGIHFRFVDGETRESKMDPGFRRDDGSRFARRRQLMR
jgi:hypothetical protein